MEPKPLTHAPSAASGEALSINLSLGIGAGYGGLRRATFTPAQLLELQQQSLILKYIVAGLPVPFHLIPPIWKSVARAFGPVSGGIYNQYPSFIGFREHESLYRSMMDPEPGRCRRTDGKKWRCSREVIPDQKYCERHMHRGCQRSRKHVEGSLVTSASGGALNSSNATTKTNSISTYTKCNLCSSIPSNLQLATPSSNTLSNTPATTPPTTTNCIGGINGGDNNVVTKNDNIATTYSSNTTTATTITTTTTGLASAAAENNSRSRSNRDQIAGKINIRGSSNNVNDCKVGSFVDPGFGVPTRTVLRAVGYSNVVETKLPRCRRTDGKKYWCSREVVPNHKYCAWHMHKSGKKLTEASQSVMVAAPPPPPPSSVIFSPPLAILHRCRRTDGRKWRCGKEVVPNRDYCTQHLHRGAKKLAVAASQSVTVAAAPPSSIFLSPPPLAIPKKLDTPMYMDTNLSISIATSPQELSNNEEASCSNSSSDATTVTDENVSVSCD
ncbi:Growth-regulating factor like [Actinidia chinensis var. chinensis]|uniref:Growth-regulating factor n=1 Tax=Actinidia chinensis var. chinensis TaxID=1590841 RepID=A0A2R6R9G6_ACTCC|nr:Growth-regulating factor like [Actinidia chinensis var. chinensis]